MGCSVLINARWGITRTKLFNEIFAQIMSNGNLSKLPRTVDKLENDIGNTISSSLLLRFKSGKSISARSFVSL